MSIRDISYADYGISEEELKKLIMFCRKNTLETDRLLLEACKEAKQEISNYILFSLVCGVSYDDLRFITYVPISKGDFYGYRRKALKILSQKIERINDGNA